MKVSIPSKISVYDDEPIQWHLATSKHDYCPECGESPLAFVGTRERHCMSCDKTFTLTLTTTAWQRMKEKP